MQASDVVADVLDEVEQQRFARQHVPHVDVFVPAGDDRLEYRIVAPADRRHLKDGAVPDLAKVAVEFR